MDKIIVKTKADSNMVEIKATLTSGKVCAILHALKESNSAVANDVRCLLRNAIYNDAKEGKNSPIPVNAYQN
jgi:hypothetical protein